MGIWVEHASQHTGDVLDRGVRTNEGSAGMRRPGWIATKMDVEEELVDHRLCQRYDTVAPLASRLCVPIKNVQTEGHL